MQHWSAVLPRAANCATNTGWMNEWTNDDQLLERTKDGWIKSYFFLQNFPSFFVSIFNWFN